MADANPNPQPDPQPGSFPPPPPPAGSVPPGGYGAPPPGAYPPPGGYGAPAGGLAPVNIGDAFAWATAKFGQYAAVLVALAAVVFAVRLVQSLISTAWLNAIANNCVVSSTVGVCTASLGQVIFVGLVLGVVFGVLAGLATIGVYRAALRATRGIPPSFADLTTGEHLGPFIAVSVVYWVASAVGLVLLVLPGLVVIFLFQFAPLYALDRGDGVGAAFGNSFRAVTANFVPVLLAALVNVVASILGGFLWGLLVLVVLPFAALFTANVYRQLNREPVAP